MKKAVEAKNAVKKLIVKWAKVAAVDMDDMWEQTSFCGGEDEFYELEHEHFFELLAQIPYIADFDDSVAVDDGEVTWYNSKEFWIKIMLKHDMAQGFIEFHLAAPTERDPERKSVYYFKEGSEFEDFFDEIEKDIEDGIEEGL